MAWAFRALRERRVRTVPAGVVDVVTRRTSFAVAALAAGAAMQDDLVRSGSPVFVDKEFRGFGGGCRAC